MLEALANYQPRILLTLAIGTGKTFVAFQIAWKLLAHVAYALPTLTREERASKAKIVLNTHFNTKQKVFLDFVLSHYVSIGVEELEPSKLTPLLRLKYNDSIADAIADLGKPAEISETFNGFQRFLYG